MENRRIRDFYDLDTWQKGNELVIKIYKVTQRFPKDELYGITSQIRRAASSITANIAEGFSRYHFNDKIRFYYNARGSVSETQNFLFLSHDIGYLNTSSFSELFEFSKEVGMLINGLIRSIEKQK